MSEQQVVQGRPIGPSELAQIRQLMAAHPNWSRHRLSQELATLWDWRNGAGQLKDMAARSLLLKLEQRRCINLPPRRQRASNRMGQKRMPRLEWTPLTQRSLNQSLASLLPLAITEVSTQAGAGQRPLFEALLQEHHYLSYRGSVGENLQYLVCEPQGHPVACMLFGAAAWQCADRDRSIGWNSLARVQNLHLLANNTRFLIPAWVQVPHLASHVLSRIARRVSGDWQGKYGHPIYLLETFVQRDRFPGRTYAAANWVWAGQTKGRSRQDRTDGSHHQVPIKNIYLYPLHPRFRELLQGKPPTQTAS